MDLIHKLTVAQCVIKRAMLNVSLNDKTRNKVFSQGVILIDLDEVSQRGSALVTADIELTPGASMLSVEMASR